MNLGSEFAVAHPPETVWRVISDPRRLASCLPAAVVEAESESGYEGRATVSVGPINLALRGRLIILERDDRDHGMVLKICAEERFGQGTVAATMIVSVSVSEIGSDIKADATVQLSGKISQFSAPVIKSMSNSIMRKFVKKLGALVATDAAIHPAAG
jgi:carbon monoxide dehydrogenase subunit G